MKGNPAVQKDPLDMYLADLARVNETHGSLPEYWNDGKVTTEEDVYKHLILIRDVWLPLFEQACDQSVGGRRFA